VVADLEDDRGPRAVADRGEDPTARCANPVARRVAAWALPAAAAALCLLGLARGGPELLPQGIHNQAIAMSPDLAAAAADLNRVWPPLYPLLLWTAHRAGFAPRATNGLLFLASLGLLGAALRRVAPRGAPWMLALFALGSFQVGNLRHLVSEVLLTPLAVAVLLLLAGYRARPSGGRLAALAAVSALACLTRYFALFWLVPVVALEVARTPRDGRRRALRTGLLLAGALLPLGLWMLDARARTGYLTGMDRFAPRGLSAQTSLGGNVEGLARTLGQDLIVPWRGAAATRLAASPLRRAGEVAFGAVALAALAGVALASRRAGRATGGAPGATPGPVGWLAGSYLVALLALWTVGNNDPIHSRFVYPVYPFLLLGFAAAAERARAPAAPPWGPAAATIASAALAAAHLAAAALRLGAGPRP